MDNFFILDNKFYIIIDGENHEVCEQIYNAYKKIEYHTEYLDRKYKAWNKSLDENILLFSKYGYMSQKNQNSLEESYIISEDNARFFQRFSNIERFILKRILQGYSESEIATELGVSRQTINYHKNKIKHML